MRGMNEVRLLAAEEAYQKFVFADGYRPAAEGDWKVKGSNFVRSVHILYDAEEEIFGHGEFGVSFAENESIPDQIWAMLDNMDISRDGISVKKRDRRGYEAPRDLEGLRLDAAEQAYLDFEFEDGLLPCGQDEWRIAGDESLIRVFYINGGENEADRQGAFKVEFEPATDCIAGVSAMLDGLDIASRPHCGLSLSRPPV